MGIPVEAPHNVPAIEGDNNYRKVRFEVPLQVFFLVHEIAVIQVGKFPEYLYTQPGQIRDVRRDVAAAEALDTKHVMNF